MDYRICMDVSRECTYQSIDQTYEWAAEQRMVWHLILHGKRQLAPRGKDCVDVAERWIRLIGIIEYHLESRIQGRGGLILDFASPSPHLHHPNDKDGAMNTWSSKTNSYPRPV